MLKTFSRFLSYLLILSFIAPVGGMFGTEQASAATIMAVDSFGTFDTFDVPNWVDGGGNTTFDTYTSNNTPRPGSATTHHARLRDGGHITKTVSTGGYQNIILNFYWHGDTQAESSDKFLVQWKKTADVSFTTLQSYNLNTQTNGWSSKISLPLPINIGNESIDIRFVGASNSNTEEARVDDVSVDGTPITSPILAPIGNQTINELSTLTFTATSTPTSPVFNFPALYTLSGTVPSGAAIDNVTGVFTWTPTEAQGPGTYTFTVDAIASEGIMDSETITVTVNEVNASPIADTQVVTTDEDTPTTITLTGTDSDLPATQTLTYGIASQPTHGTATLTGATVTYTPTANYNGSDSFTFTTNDGTASSTPATVSITVSPINDAPVAEDSSVSTHVNTPLSVDMVANDLIDNNNNLTYTIIDGPLHGTVGDVDGNTITYTPNENFVGVDEFTFKVNDGSLDSNVAAVTITVSNDAPSLQEIQNFTIPEGVPFSFTALGSDENQDTLTYGFGIDMLTAATIDPVTGVFNWTPEEVEGPGTYQFVVTVSDGVASDSKMFTITVTEVNVAPILGELPSEVTIPELAPYTFTATATDADRPVNTLTFSLGEGAPEGATINSETGVFNWTPTEEQGPGEYTFVVQVMDNGELSDTGKMSITVTEVTPPDMCSNIEGIQETVPEGFTANDGICTRNTPPVSSGGGGGGFYSLGGCKDSTATNYDPYVTTDNGSCMYPPKKTEGGNATTTDTGGQVLGASTSCGISITKYLRSSHKNDSEQVKKLQKFLNDYLKLNIPLTGVFGPRTERAVKQFQTLRKENILAPWKLDAATGVVYLTTATDINNIMCPDLKLPIPTTLVPYHE